MSVLDKFLNTIKITDPDDDFYDDDIDMNLDDEDDFMDDDFESRPKKNFFSKFAKKPSKDLDDDFDDIEDDLDELDDLEELDLGEEEEPVKIPKAKPQTTFKTSIPKAPKAPKAPKQTKTASAAPKFERERTREVEKPVREKPVREKPSKITPMRDRRSASSSMEVCVIRPTSMESTREIADTLLDKATVILNLEGIDLELAQRIIDFTSGACYALDGSLQKISSYIFVLGPSNVEITGDHQSILNGSAPSVRAGY